jgi:hypothetical protein
MWHKRLLSADIEAGYREWYWSNPDTDEVALQTEWLVEPIAEAAKARFNQYDERSRYKDDVLNHVAYIPMWVIEHEWRVNRRNMLADKEYVRHWANDPANSGFRTRPGKL